MKQDTNIPRPPHLFPLHFPPRGIDFENLASSRLWYEHNVSADAPTLTNERSLGATADEGKSMERMWFGCRLPGWALRGGFVVALRLDMSRARCR
jgi:hypothetical protein